MVERVFLGAVELRSVRLFDLLYPLSPFKAERDFRLVELRFERVDARTALRHGVYHREKFLVVFDWPFQISSVGILLKTGTTGTGSFERIQSPCSLLIFALPNSHASATVLSGILRPLGVRLKSRAAA